MKLLMMYIALKLGIEMIMLLLYIVTGRLKMVLIVGNVYSSAKSAIVMLRALTVQIVMLSQRRVLSTTARYGIA